MRISNPNMNVSHPTVACIVRIAARLRQLNEEQFVALRDLVERGEERDEHLDAVSTALLDVLSISEAERQGMRLVVA